MTSNFFTLSIVGNRVLYSNIDGEHTMTFVQAWRYLRRCQAVKIAGKPEQITGAYVIEEEPSHVY